MIVRHFLNWFETATVPGRIEAVRMMAQIYLAGELGSDTPKEAAAALTIVLDDPSISVRAALAWELAASARAPRHLVVGLAHDDAEVAAIVLARSPVLTDADLVDCVRNGESLAHLAVAMRDAVSGRVAHALVESAGPRCVAALVDNAGAELCDECYRLIVARHGDDAGLRESLHRRHDLPADVRQSLVSLTSRDLLAFVRTRGWLGGKRAERPVCETRDAATIQLAAEAADLGQFVAHLAKSEQLTPSLLLRGLLCGDTTLFGAALVCLSGVSASRVAGMLTGRSAGLIAATAVRAGLPRSMVPVFVAALAAIRDARIDLTTRDRRLQRSIIERVMAACTLEDQDDMRPVFAMLRRFEAEVARAEARAEVGQIKSAEAEPVVDLLALEAELLDAPADLIEGQTQASGAPQDPATQLDDETAARSGFFARFRRRPSAPQKSLPPDLEALFENVVAHETVATPLSVVGTKGSAMPADFFAADTQPVTRAAQAA